MDKRYPIVLGAILVQSVTIGCVFAYGIFFSVLETEFGWSRTLLSVASAVAFFNMGVFAILAGRLTDRFGPRGVLMVTALSTGLAYVLMYFLSAPWQLLLIYGLLVGMGLSTHDVVTLSTIAKWFPRRRGVMSGVVKVGAALGQMALPVIAVALIASVGWRVAFLVIGISAAILLLIAAWLMGLKPVQLGQSSALEERHFESSGGMSFREARQGKELWTLCAMQFFFFGALVTIPTHIVPHSIDSGMSATAAATVLSTIAACSVAGRLLMGGCIDKIGGKRGFNICLLFLLISLLTLMFIDTETRHWLYVFAAIYGFAHGGLFTLVSPTVAEYFGMQSHGAIFGVIVFTGTAFGSVLPILTGLIFDRLQSYNWAFILLAAMVSASLLLSLRLTPSASK